MESGADFHGKSVPALSLDDALKYAKQIAAHFKCNDEHKWIDCLRRPNASDFLQFARVPTPLDGTEFLPHFAQQTFKSDNYSKGNARKGLSCIEK